MKTYRLICALALLALAPLAVAEDTAGNAEKQAETRSVHLLITGPEQLAAEGWQRVTDEDWRARLDSSEARVTFGRTAVERGLEWIDRELAELRDERSKSAAHQARRLYLEEQRDQLLGAQRALDTKATSSGSICYGSYEFEQTAGPTGLASYGGESRSLYTEFGPLSPGNKTAFADVEVYSGSANDYDSDSNTVGSSWSVSAQANASLYPYFSANVDTYGYVLVTDSAGCTDIVSLETSF